MVTGASPTPRWGCDAIDPRAFNLPALKVKYLLSRLPASGAVLEVGSGEGKILRTIAAQRPDLRVHGCDVRPETNPIELVEFRQMTRDIPYADATFDAVLVVDVLEHVDDPHHLLAEMARVLRPGGRFVGFVPIEGEPRSIYALYRRLFGADLYVKTKEHVQAYRFADLVKMLERHFAVTDISHAYHALGHLMDATFFAAASLPRLGHFWWRENTYYAGAQKSRNPLAVVLNRALELGNALAYVESRLLAKFRPSAAGLLFEVRRPVPAFHDSSQPTV